MVWDYERGVLEGDAMADVMVDLTANVDSNANASVAANISSTTLDQGSSCNGASDGQRDAVPIWIASPPTASSGERASIITAFGAEQADYALTEAADDFDEMSSKTRVPKVDLTSRSSALWPDSATPALFSPGLSQSAAPLLLPSAESDSRDISGAVPASSFHRLFSPAGSGSNLGLGLGPFDQPHDRHAEAAQSVPAIEMPSLITEQRQLPTFGPTPRRRAPSISVSKKATAERLWARCADDPPAVLVAGLGPVKERRPVQLEEFRSLLHVDRSVPVWIDVEGIPRSVVAIIGEVLNLHSLTVEDCTHADSQAGNSTALEREKLEVFRRHRYCFIQYHALTEEEADIAEIIPVKMLVFDNLVLTLHQAPLPVFDRIAAQLGGKPLNIAWLVYDFLKAITGRFLYAVEQVLAEIVTLDELMDVLSREEQSDWLRRLRVVRRAIIQVQLTLAAKRRIINSMSKEGEVSKYFPNIHYLHDLFDQASTMLTRLEFGADMLESIQDSFVAKASLEVATFSFDISIFMRRLSLVATLILPLGLIAGMWGMNVKLPGMIDTDEDTEGFLPFGMIMGFSVTLVVSGLIYIKTKKLW